MGENTLETRAAIEAAVNKLLEREPEDDALQAISRISRGENLTYEEERTRMILIHLLEAIRISSNPEPRMLQWITAEGDLMDEAVAVIRSEWASEPPEFMGSMQILLRTLLFGCPEQLQSKTEKEETK